MTSCTSRPEVQNLVVMACSCRAMGGVVEARIATEDRVEGGGEEAEICA